MAQLQLQFINNDELIIIRCGVVLYKEKPLLCD